MKINVVSRKGNLIETIDRKIHPDGKVTYKGKNYFYDIRKTNIRGCCIYPWGEE